MRTTFPHYAIAGLTAFTALGSMTIAGSAEAGGSKPKQHHGLTVIIGDGYPGYGYGYGYRSFGRSTGCGWLFERYEETGSTKWYKRWHACKYGW